MHRIRRHKNNLGGSFYKLTNDLLFKKIIQDSCTDCKNKQQKTNTMRADRTNRFIHAGQAVQCGLSGGL